MLIFRKFARKTNSAVIPDHDKFFHTPLNQQSSWSMQKFSFLCFISSHLETWENVFWKNIRNFFRVGFFFGFSSLGLEISILKYSNFFFGKIYKIFWAWAWKVRCQNIRKFFFLEKYKKFIQGKYFWGRRLGTEKRTR